MNHKNIFLFCILLLGFAAGKGQNPWVVKGDRSFETGDYLKAIEYYEWALRKQDIPDAWMHLGDTYLKIDDYESAEKCYRKAAGSPNPPAEAAFKLGQVLMSLGKYSEAATWFDKTGAQKAEDPQLKAMAKSSVEYTSLLKDSSRMVVEDAPFNTAQSEFGPMYYKNGIVFSSSRKFNLGVIYTSRVNGQPLLDLYYIEPNNKGEWKHVVPFSFSLNTRFNEGPVTFSPDGNTIYFTRNNSKGGKKSADKKDKLRKLRIYSAERSGDKFKNIQPVSFNLDGYATGHPALAPDGTYMLFVSDRPGGFGGTDIYRVWKNGNTWSEPENLGPGINSQGNEMFPWVHSDGTLYYSTDGRGGLGDLDIFAASATAKGWINPQNMGYPVNSSFDDFGIIFSADKRSGFFSSNRNGGGFNDDLFTIRIDRPAFECQPQVENVYCVTLFEENTLSLNEPGDNTSLVYEWDLGDGIFKRGIEVDHCFPGPGFYDVKLNVVDSISGFLFMNYTQTVVEIKDNIQVYISSPDVVSVNTEVPLDGLKSNLPGITVKNYYWEFGDGGIAEGAEVSHAWSAEGEYEIQLGIIGEDEKNPGEEYKECRSRRIRITRPETYAMWKDSVTVAEEKRRDAERKNLFAQLEYHMPDTTAQANAQGSNTPKGRPDQVEIVAHSNPIEEVADPKYTVKIAESEERIPKNSKSFKGMNNVMEFKTPEGYTYTVGSEKDIEKLKPLWSQVVTLGFEEATVVPFKGKTLFEHPDSLFFMMVPGSNKAYAFSKFEGRLVDSEGNPMAGDITFEDLNSGKIFQKVPADSAGNFYIELPNGKLYGYYADKEGFFPVSDYVDLRRVRSNLKFTGNLKTVSMTEMIEKGTAVRINNLFFDPGKWTLRRESYRELDRLARILNENSSLKAMVEGHTDDVGSSAYNLELSEMRAKSVVKYLILAGYNVNKVSFMGSGEDKPVAPNTNELSRKLNRRVDFRFVP